MRESSPLSFVKHPCARRGRTRVSLTPEPSFHAASTSPISDDLNHRGTGDNGVVGALAYADAGHRDLAGCEVVVTPEDNGSSLRGPW